jgi:hypothetical protein
MNRFQPLEIRLGSFNEEPRLLLEVLGYQHPDTAEPANLDLLSCRVTAHASSVNATFDMSIGLWELLELRDYLEKISTGNGPQQSIAAAAGLLTLSFAPTRRGPVLCGVLVKSIDASHLRLEYLITLEPQDIARTLFDLSALRVQAQR